MEKKDKERILDPRVIEGLVCFSLLMGSSREITKKSPGEVSWLYYQCLHSLDHTKLFPQKKSLGDRFKAWQKKWEDILYRRWN